MCALKSSFIADLIRLVIMETDGPFCQTHWDMHFRPITTRLRAQGHLLGIYTSTWNNRLLLGLMLPLNVSFCTLCLQYGCGYGHNSFLFLKHSFSFPVLQSDHNHLNKYCCLLPCYRIQHALATYTPDGACDRLGALLEYSFCHEIHSLAEGGALQWAQHRWYLWCSSYVW